MTKARRPVPLREIESKVKSPGARAPAKERIAWAGDRLWDVAEGAFTPAESAYLYTMIVGWGDLATADERRQYYALAKQLNELRKTLGHIET